MYRKSCSTSDDPSLLEEISTKMVDNLKGLAEDLVMAGMTVWGIAPNMVPIPYYVARCQK